MQTERQEVLATEFLITDINGQVHKAILVGVLNVTKFDKYMDTVKEIQYKDKYVTTMTEWVEKAVDKQLLLGLSITNPTDVYNYEFGVQVAKGRALKPNKRLGAISTSSRGMLGEAMCHAIMAQQIQFIHANQELFVKVKPVVVSSTYKVPESV